LGVTLFGIFLTPVFYFVIQWVSDKRQEVLKARELSDRLPEDGGEGDPTHKLDFPANGDGEHGALTGNGLIHTQSHRTHGRIGSSRLECPTAHLLQTPQGCT